MRGHRLRRDKPGQPRLGIEARSLAEWHRREARRLRAGRQGAAAAWHLDRLAEMQPEDASIAVELAAAYEMAADWANVERAASLAIAAGSGDVDNLVRRGWARIHLGQAGRGRRRFPPGTRARTRIGRVPARAVPGVGRAGRAADANALWGS